MCRRSKCLVDPEAQEGKVIKKGLVKTSLKRDRKGAAIPVPSDEEDFVYDYVLFEGGRDRDDQESEYEEESGDLSATEVLNPSFVYST